MMKYLIISIFILLALESSLASDVLEYTDANFESKITQHDVALVEFYAPWCGHCKRLAPEYETAATALKSNDPPVSLIKVDCTVETKTCGKYGVNGYPTLKIFKNGESTDYNGPRESDGIIKYMRSRAGPASKELNTVEEFDKFLSNFEHSIIGFFSKTDSALATEFKKVADQLSESLRFAHTTNQDILAKYNHIDKVVIYQPPRLQVVLEPKENVYTGTGTSSDLKKFLQENLHGIVGHRTTANSQDFKKPLVVVLYNLDYIRDPKGSNYVRNRVIKVAQKLKSENLGLTFAVSSVDEFRNELTEFGVESPESSGKFIIGRGSKDQKYKFEGEYSVENLEKFSRDLAAGNLEQFLKSEPVPTSNSDAVITVVAKNFDQVVNDANKDVLIEFYAPWCGHCKSLAPKYEELANKLKDEDEILIAKFDATANDVPSLYNVQGFPTLFFVPKDGKNAPRKYEGGREVDDFIKYLAKESTNPLKGYDRNGKKLKKTTKEDL
jgi:protein disulfide-isomerase A3